MESSGDREAKAQHDRFIEAARELGADEDEATFKAKLAVIGKQSRRTSRIRPMATRATRRMETPLQMCDRHVREGLGRLARHDVMAAAFERSGRLDLAEAAREFRRSMVEFQTDAEHHAARLRAEGR